MEAEKVAIKTQEEQFQEAVEALKVIASFVGKVSSDGKVNASDFKHVVELAKDFSVIMDGVEGISEAMPPALNRRFGTLSFEAIFSIFEAFKSGKAVESPIEEIEEIEKPVISEIKEE